MAYGQTGAGKTFTMLDFFKLSTYVDAPFHWTCQKLINSINRTGATENYKHRGIIPRAISQLFKEISDRSQQEYNVKISYLEIYKEQMIDLLVSLPNSSSSSSTSSINNNNNNSLSVVEDKVTGITTVKGLTIQPVTTEEEALHLLFEGEMNRSISEHQLNSNSTRSHCIFTVYLESRSKVESSERVIYSKLNLVDLAGSERLSKTETSGISLKEAMCIISFFLITFYIFRIFFFLI